MRTQPARVHEATTERKNQDKKRTYETRRTQPRGRAKGRREGNRPLRHNFVVELKDLIVVPNIADKLRPLVKSDKVLGPHKGSWCEFHEAFGHHINNFLALGYQLDELVKNGFLKDYLVGCTTTAATATPEEGQTHEMPTHGEVHTISGSFSGGGPTASQRKKYVRSVSSFAEEFPDDPWDADLVFTRADLRDVVPHYNDPVVISIVTAGRKVHRVLVDQDNLVEVRGYLELRTTFTDGAASRTENIWYLVVNTNSAYNILLGRPALNRLRAVSSTRHMKMKLPDLSGKVIVIKSDQEEAHKCYENSLKTKRGVVMVIERPLVSDSQMELEPSEEATPAKSMPVEATHVGATPIEDAHTKGRYGDASPMEGVYGEASPTEEEPEEAMPDASVRATPMEEDSMNESRSKNVQSEQPQPIDNVVERQIGGYNQIKMHPRDESKTVFMTETSSYCYKVMPFGLKKCRRHLPEADGQGPCTHARRNVQAYVDDMVVTSHERGQHAADLEELFATISRYHLKLNPEKCIFGVEAGKFLGFMLTERGIEANSDKCAAIIAMRSPTSVKEVQQLTGRMAALSRFVSAGGQKGNIYFQCLKRNSRFAWTDECEAAFLKLKEYLAMPPVLCKPQVGVPLRLYFAVTEWAISYVLVQEQDQVQKPIYFVSKALQGPELRYQLLEKATLAVVFSARRLRHYFHSFTMVVMTNLPIQKVLQKPDVVGRMVRWAVELSEFDIQYEPRGSIKGQALRFAFKASNNQVEYEALIAGMLLAKEMGAQSLLAKSDSQLVTVQVTGEYQAKDPQMAAYLRYVEVLKRAFAAFELVHVPREQNARAELLAKLASSGKGGRQRTVIQEALKTPRKFVADNKVDVLHISTARGKPRSHRSLSQDMARAPCISTYTTSPEEGKGMQVCALEEGDTWMTPYRRYIADGILPAELEEGKKIKRNAASLVYGSDAMIPVEIHESSPRFIGFVAEESNEERKVNLDLIDEAREEARIKAEAVKRRVEPQYSSKVKLRQFQVGDLVMRKAHPYELENKLSPKWTRPFRVIKAKGNGSYKLETLEGGPIPPSWNAANLKFYFS
ncbi:uncharacterized protein [Phaseolus vulgaris]|uniref:uncharacterized protein n=1 Tax=Phaseolus vulgaris TaxID=3885 RepID=UPI0035CB8E98